LKGACPNRCASIGHTLMHNGAPSCIKASSRRAAKAWPFVVGRIHFSWRQRMKYEAADRGGPKAADPRTATRRNLLVGAGVAGAAALAAKTLPIAPATAPEALAAAKPAPDPAGGYQLTQHVLRYYQTAKV
jgi:hypothetical protein